MRSRTSLQVHIATLFLALLLVVAVLIGGYGYHTSRSMLESSTSDLMDQINRETTGDLNATLQSAALATSMLSRTGLPQAASHDERMELLPLLKEALRSSVSVVSLYAGYGNGDMFMLRRLRNENDVQLFKAPAGTRYMVQSIERRTKAASGLFLYMDEELNILREEDKPDYAATYDPRSRGWYKESIAKGEPVTSQPYVFFTARRVGLTISVPAENLPVVVGGDIQLDSLGEILKRQKPTPGSELALVNTKGQMVAHEDIASIVHVPKEADGKPELKLLTEVDPPALAALGPTISGLEAGEGARYNSTIDAAGERFRVTVSSVRVQGSSPYHLAIAIPERELLATALEQRNRSFLLTIAIVLSAIPVTLWLSRRVSRPIRALARHAREIQRFDFSRSDAVRSPIMEVDELATTMDGMKGTIRRFLAISEAVASEEDFDRLLPMLLSETLAAADAGAGVLYLADEDTLKPAAALDSAGASLLAAMKPLPQDASGLLGTALRLGAPAQGPLGAGEDVATGLGALPQAASLGQALAVPLLNRNHQRVGALLLLRAAAFDPAQVSFIKALSGSAASSLETRELIRSQKALFEAFIQLIAGAIDAKSPYTGGHCERVPELTKMLAREACAQKEGPFRDFELDEDGWEALHVAAWLHDCGKITTPEYVVDKATKLETIHDRIHEVRMRFEVLKRDAEIDCLKAIVAGEDEAAARERLAEAWRRLDEDFAFIGACNEGGEFMAPEKLERLRTVAARTWLRTLDDRVGISQEELQRKSREPAATLPVREPLLADKPEHRIERRPQDRIPADNPWGFRMTVPQLLYDRGELHNLSVGRGTLTEEDRYKINEHIVQTLIMLSRLPFPKHMRAVPEIAGGHHEKMDGTGYPKRLRKDDMSPVARMMAIADVFEALTAADRPYKKGKKLSEAIRIMSFMKKDQHLDPDLFDLFLRSGIYRAYAERYMPPEQIDEVDVTPYLGAAAA